MTDPVAVVQLIAAVLGFAFYFAPSIYSHFRKRRDITRGSRLIATLVVNHFAFLIVPWFIAWGMAIWGRQAATIPRATADEIPPTETAGAP